MGSSDYNAIILAAGRSQRFGEPKFSLRFDANNTFLEKIIAEYVAFGCNKIVVVINQECLSFIHKIALLPSDRVEMVINPNPEAGRFSSINAGLAVLTGTNPAFIQNVDNPFVNEALLRLLVHSLKEYDGVCPAFQHKGGHPLLLSEKLVNNLKSMDNNLDFKQYLKGFDIHKQEVSDTAVLANINTVDEYKQWFSAT